jgi:hypothetical protein
MTIRGHSTAPGQRLSPCLRQKKPIREQFFRGLRVRWSGAEGLRSRQWRGRRYFRRRHWDVTCGGVTTRVARSVQGKRSAALALNRKCGRDAGNRRLQSLDRRGWVLFAKRNSRQEFRHCRFVEHQLQAHTRGKVHVADNAQLKGPR